MVSMKEVKWRPSNDGRAACAQAGLPAAGCDRGLVRLYCCARRGAAGWRGAMGRRTLRLVSPAEADRRDPIVLGRRNDGRPCPNCRAVAKLAKDTRLPRIRRDGITAGRVLSRPIAGSWALKSHRHRLVHRYADQPTAGADFDVTRAGVRRLRHAHSPMTSRQKAVHEQGYNESKTGTPHQCEQPHGKLCYPEV